MIGERKYFLDWLRATAFGFLILYHIGMLYVPWSYNLKSDRLYPGLEYLMISVSPWRLALLFFISGIASRFLLDKLGEGRFALARLRRLWVVLLLGMLVINPVQAYIELLDKGLVDGTYVSFWFQTYLPGTSFGARTLPNWDHLWFIVYLLVYSLGLALVFRVFRLRRSITCSPVWLLVLPGVWLILTTLVVEELSPVTMDLFNDWGNHARWIGLFIAGIVCATRDDIWEILRARRRLMLALATAGLVLHLGNGALWRAGLIDPDWDGFLYAVIQGYYGWTAILAMAGYAYQYLNVDTRAMRYLTDAVLPVYVVHQPILLVTAYLLFPARLPVIPEAMVLILATAIGSCAFYELLVRRWPAIRFMFGLKRSPGITA